MNFNTWFENFITTHQLADSKFVASCSSGGISEFKFSTIRDAVLQMPDATQMDIQAHLMNLNHLGLGYEQYFTNMSSSFLELEEKFFQEFE